VTSGNLLAAAALTVSGSFPLLLLVKVTAALGVVLTIIRAMRRARASRRHAVLSAGFVVLAMLPATIVLLPPVGIDIRSTPVVVTPAAPATPVTASITRASGSDAAIPVTNSARTPPRSAEASSALGTRVTPDRVSMARLFFILWVGGVVVSLAPVVISLQRLRRLRIAGECWTDGHTFANDLAAELGVRRVVDVRVHDGVTTPMTCGWRAPVVLLPRDASSWPKEDLIRALVHEFEHVRRGDGLTQLFARMVCAAYWCHPLIWVAWRQLHLAADMASDDEVVVRADARAFAMQLVTMAQTLTEGHTGVTPAMARRGSLSTRVAALLNPRQTRGRVGARFALAILGGAAACCAGLSPLTASTLPARTARTDRPLIAESAPISSPAYATAADQTQAPARIPTIVPSAAPVPLAQSRVPPNPASQTQPPRPPAADALASVRFENTTVWKASTNAGGSFHTGSGNAFIANGASIESLVAWAYGIGIVNASPARAHPWAIVDDSRVRMQPAMAERFDIRGKASFASREPEAGTLGALHYMVQDLLSNRFGLVAHWETRQRSVFVLHALSGGLDALGPGIRQSALDCDAISIGAVAGQTSTPALFRMNDVQPALNFSKASPRDIISSIAKMADIDVVFDGAYADPRPYTLEMKDATLEQALDLVTKANQLFYKVVNQRTILIANDTAPKRAQYNEPVVNVPPPREQPNAGRPACNISIASQGMDSPFLPSRVPSGITGRAVSMQQLATALSHALRYEVIDATSLPGRYDLDLRVGLTGGQSPNDALRQQLGLWLEEQRAPGEVLVIDRVSSPRLD
jgi:beta-lactamase regulating signal transducer with metallopeptidase domain